jgi:thiol-disulfide isomerase/thioredoxin
MKKLSIFLNRSFLFIIFAFVIEQAWCSPKSNSTTILLRLSNYTGEFYVELYKENNRLDTVVGKVYSGMSGKVFIHIPDSLNEADYLLLKVYTMHYAEPIILPVLYSPKEDSIELEIIFPVEKDNVFQKIKIIKSDDNRQYYSFLSKSQQYQQKQKMILQLASLYPDTSAFYLTLSNELTKVKQEELSFYAEYLKINRPSSVQRFIQRHVQNVGWYKEMTPFDKEKDIYFLKSPLLMQFVWQYLYHFKDKVGTTHELPNTVRAYRHTPLHLAIDTLHILFSSLPKNYGRKVFEQLANAFAKNNKEEIAVYIYKAVLPNYTEQCENPEITATLAKLEQLQVGAKVPDILFDKGNFYSDTKQLPAKLSEINKDKILLVFWASWCSHCQQQIPKLFETLKKYPNVQVVSISLDMDKGEWKKFIKENGLSKWLNYCDGEGWKSQIVNAYNVHSTPTMFVLDKDKKIIAKPVLPEQLAKFFSDKNKIESKNIVNSEK